MLLDTIIYILLILIHVFLCFKLDESEETAKSISSHTAVWLWGEAFTVREINLQEIKQDPRHRTALFNTENLCTKKCN